MNNSLFLRNLAREVFDEMIGEATTLRSLIVKADDEQRANEAMNHLKKNGIDSRVVYPSKFNPFDSTEKDGWGVMVEPSDIDAAAKILGSESKGLVFDPVVKGR